MVRKEGGYLVTVLLGQHRAGSVDQPSAGLEQRRGGRQQRRLLTFALGKRGWPQSPLAVRPPATGARTRAGGGDEDHVEAGTERRECDFVSRVQHVRIAYAGPLQPLDDGPQPL